jgi:hypothetical protein
MNARFLSCSLLVLGLSFVSFGRSGAQSTPAPLPSPTPIVVPTLPPSDATTQTIIRAAAGLLNEIITANRVNAANSTRGTVSYYHRFDMQVQTGADSYRSVRLHQGTTINPRGARPGPGTAVEISGRGSSDGMLEADTITVVR